MLIPVSSNKLCYQTYATDSSSPRIRAIDQALSLSTPTLVLHRNNPRLFASRTTSPIASCATMLHPSLAGTTGAGRKTRNKDCRSHRPATEHLISYTPYGANK